MLFLGPQTLIYGAKNQSEEGEENPRCPRKLERSQSNYIPRNAYSNVTGNVIAALISRGLDFSGYCGNAILSLVEFDDLRQLYKISKYDID